MSRTLPALSRRIETFARSSALAGAVLAAVSLGAPASAATLLFSGTAHGIPAFNPANGPDASCAPLPFRSIVSLPGVSSLGSFTYNVNNCISGTPGGPITGLFTFDFGVGDAFSGTLEGFNPPTQNGLTDVYLTHTITSGTGRFLNASGTLTNVGVIDLTNAPSLLMTFDLAGAIEAPAVPEPDIWAMMVIGLGLVGAALRMRTSQRPVIRTGVRFS